MKIKNKLITFQQIIERDASEQIGKAAADSEEIFFSARSEIIKNAEEISNNRYAAELRRASLQKNTDIANASARTKRELYDLRGRLTDDLYEKIAARLNDFTKSSGYYDYLRGKIDAVIKSNFLDENAIKIILSRGDIHLTERLSSDLKIAVTAGTDDFGGGFILILKNNGALDKSFKTRLEEARENFNSIRITG